MRQLSSTDVRFGVADSGGLPGLGRERDRRWHPAARGRRRLGPGPAGWSPRTRKRATTIPISSRTTRDR